MSNGTYHHIRSILIPILIIIGIIAPLFLFSCTPDEIDVPEVTLPPVEKDDIVEEDNNWNDTVEQQEEMNIVINHTNFDWYDSQSQEVFNKVADMKIYFAHASVGENIMEGFANLQSADPAKYPLVQNAADDSPPAQTTNGIIYDHDRGNPGWAAKVGDFETCIQNGWHYPNVDIAINKFCWIDQNAKLTTYLDSMIALESGFPDTKFVYFTMPYSTEKNTDAVLRTNFNIELRNWIETQNNKLLFDLADIEAHDPDGVQQTFTNKNTEYENLYPKYTFDSGHLNNEGQRRAATGLYSLFGQLVNSSSN
jgi:hypothetical protein